MIRYHAMKHLTTRLEVLSFGKDTLVIIDVILPAVFGPWPCKRIVTPMTLRVLTDFDLGSERQILKISRESVRNVEVCHVQGREDTKA